MGLQGDAAKPAPPIITVVSPVSIGGTLENPTVAFALTQKVGAIATCINLLEGDITTAIDPA
jgi:hypothetical protein